MREKAKTFVSTYFTLLFFPQISLSLISVVAKEYNLRTATSENISQAISPTLDSPYIGIKVKPFLRALWFSF